MSPEVLVVLCKVFFLIEEVLLRTRFKESLGKFGHSQF